MLALDRLSKRYASGGGVVAVHDLSVEVPEGAFFTLLGPSGCGKTTTLRCVAGLERPDGGVIAIGGTVVSDPARGVHVPPHRRAVGMVFQAPTVWPHMTVRRNVAFPLLAAPRGARPSRAEAARLVDDALRRVRLTGLDDRPATDLSGGQQQRLALARALARGPRLLLLDEPLSALDATLREEIGAELRRIQSELGVTTVYVTHDRDEALTLSTHVAVVRAGRLEQVGTPRALYEDPVSAFVAQALGPANLVPARVLAVENGHVVVDTAHGRLRVPAPGRAEGGPVAGGRVVLVARPEHVRLSEVGDAVVTASSFLRDVVDVALVQDGAALRARLPVALAPAPGASVGVAFDEARLTLVAEDDHDAG